MWLRARHILRPAPFERVSFYWQLDHVGLVGTESIRFAIELLYVANRTLATQWFVTGEMTGPESGDGVRELVFPGGLSRARN